MCLAGLIKAILINCTESVDLCNWTNAPLYHIFYGSNASIENMPLKFCREKAIYRSKHRGIDRTVWGNYRTKTLPLISYSWTTVSQPFCWLTFTCSHPQTLVVHWIVHSFLHLVHSDYNFYSLYLNLFSLQLKLQYLTNFKPQLNDFYSSFRSVLRTFNLLWPLTTTFG